MGALASQITSLTIVYSTVDSDADQRKHQSSASLAFVQGIHRGPMNSPHKWSVTQRMFPFDDVIMAPISNYIHVKEWDVITHPYPNINFNGSLVKLPFKSGHGWVITPIKTWM